MHVKTIAESGFCHGVKAAVQKAKESLKSGKKVYLYGDLVNNRHVMAQLTAAGCTVIDDPTIAEEGAVLVIRAHGVGRSVYEAAKAEIVDCTCPKVKSVQKKAAEKSNAGYNIVIIGKKTHPEVLGILGWCKNGSAVVAETEAELSAAELSAPLCVVAQTTCAPKWWQQAVQIICAKVPTAEICNTLCNVTDKRMAEAAKLAAECDIMIAVGDKKSANSLELYKACTEKCRLVYFVSCVEELREFSYTSGTVGIVGSASAPDEVVEEIINHITHVLRRHV